MWVERGGAPWKWQKARKHIFVFSKSKNSPRKNCNQLHVVFKKVKSCQVNILILDFYLLELSNYKKNKTKSKKLMK